MKNPKVKGQATNRKQKKEKFRKSVDFIDCCPKFATGLNNRIDIVQTVNHFGKRTAWSLKYIF